MENGPWMKIHLLSNMAMFHCHIDFRGRIQPGTETGRVVDWTKFQPCLRTSQHGTHAKHIVETSEKSWRFCAEKNLMKTTYINHTHLHLKLVFLWHGHIEPPWGFLKFKPTLQCNHSKSPRRKTHFTSRLCSSKVFWQNMHKDKPNVIPQPMVGFRVQKCRCSRKTT